jgi:hypothetical protein
VIGGAGHEVRTRALKLLDRAIEILDVEDGDDAILAWADLGCLHRQLMPEEGERGTFSQPKAGVLGAGLTPADV